MIENVLARFSAFKSEAVSLFSHREESIHRLVAINVTYEKLKGLSTRQEDMLRQALRCVEVGAYRAAHVMAWSAVIDRVQEKLEIDSFALLNSAMLNWNILDLTDLRERYSEHSIIDAAKKAKLISKNQQKAFQGLLTRRNECAHPSNYYPDLNQSLGYVSEVIARIGEV